MKRRSLLFPVELWEQASLKAKAHPSGMTLSQAIRQLVAKWLDDEIEL